ncbi:hypothetical protein [Rhodococcus sp. BH5]|uniref:hypothetical protein n=1 Tax=Rhodococcus sp. BH5 TaxID=2871702 RepID=UPI0022CD32AB|nr:hypothetical protein [Rhodococcus sp. BH5]MCZ9635340.1 hypothetical protein [Rhodococcus sp. BH5]
MFESPSAGGCGADLPVALDGALGMAGFSSISDARGALMDVVAGALNFSKIRIVETGWPTPSAATRSNSDGARNLSSLGQRN